jgi:hypothetical protein
MEGSVVLLLNLLEGGGGLNLPSTAHTFITVCLYLAQLRNEIWNVTKRFVTPYFEVVVHHCQFAESDPVLRCRVK